MHLFILPLSHVSIIFHLYLFLSFYWLKSRDICFSIYNSAIIVCKIYFCWKKLVQFFQSVLKLIFVLSRIPNIWMCACVVWLIMYQYFVSQIFARMGVGAKIWVHILWGNIIFYPRSGPFDQNPINSSLKWYAHTPLIFVHIMIKWSGSKQKYAVILDDMNSQNNIASFYYSLQ